MILLHGRYEFFGRRVDGVRLQENFRRAAPDHHDARDLVFLLEFLDVVLDLHGQIVFGPALLHVRAVKAS